MNLPFKNLAPPAKGLGRAIFWLMLVFGLSSTTYAAVFCVTTPTELQNTLTTASFNAEDDAVKVVQGTYMGNFANAAAEAFNLSIKGGYTAGCASRVVDPSNTVLDGNSNGQVLVLNATTTADFIVDGLTVQNGQATHPTNDGGGLYISTDNGEVTLSNNIISNNSADNKGGGAYIEGANTVTLTDTTVSNNSIGIAYQGAGVYLTSVSEATLINNTVSNNTGSCCNGDGVYLISVSNTTLTNNIISGNSGEGVELLSSATSVTLNNNTITSNGDNGVYLSSSGVLVTLTNNTINNNTDEGVVLSSASEAILTNNTITGNFDNGVHLSSVSKTTLTNNTISDNMGGVYLSSISEATLTNNTINGNTRTSGGGGVRLSYSNATLSNNTITNNTSTYGSGGGVYVAYRGKTTFIDNTISDNAANYTGYEGGGVYIYESDEAIFINNVITSNTADDLGGGVYIYRTDATILTNNTISSNQADNGGGIGIYLYDDSEDADIYNNLIWNNQADVQGNDLYINNDGNGNYIRSTVNLFNNDFDQSLTGTFIKLPILIDPSNLDNFDPLFVDAPNGDYHLQASSPVIDAGDNNAPRLPLTDKDGDPRIVNGTVDMGAYEYQGSATLTLSPSSGEYVSTQTFDVTLIVETTTVSVVDLHATLDGSNITTPLQQCVISGTLTSGGETLRCPHIAAGSVLGLGTHTLNVTVDLSDGSSANDEVSWEVLENAEPALTADSSINVANSLALSPFSGKYVSTQGFDVTLIVKAADVTVVSLSATLDGNNVTAPLQGCVIPGTLILGGETFRCPNVVAGPILGVGTHTLAVTVDLSDGSSVSDEVSWEVLENSE